MRPWVFAGILLLSLLHGLFAPVNANELTVGTGAFSSIQAAVNAAKSGDTVYVAPGTYTENVKVNKPLRIIATSGQPMVRAADASKDVFLLTSQSVRMEGLTIVGGASGVQIQNTSKCVVANIIARNNVRGVYLSHSTENEISNTNFADNGYGVYGDSASQNKISANVVTGSTGNGQTLGDGIFLNYGDSNTITHNNLSANHVFGISLYSSPRNIVSNNTFSDNDLVGIRIGPGSNDNAISFNMIAGNGKASQQAAQQFPPSGILIVSATGNRIYLNNFVSQPSAILGASAAILNSPEKMVYSYNDVERTGYMSNYYSDYVGTDSNGTGIGSTPSAYGDLYPLIHPVSQYGNIRLASAAALTRTESSNESTNAVEQAMSVEGGVFNSPAVPIFIVLGGIGVAAIVAFKWTPKRDT